MVTIASVPAVGIGPNGKPVSLMFNSGNNRALVTSNVQSVGTSETLGNPLKYGVGRFWGVYPPYFRLEKLTPSWNQVSVTSLYADGGKVIALGFGVDSNYQIKQIAINNISGQWNIGLSPFNNVRTVGISKNGAKYLVANGAIYETAFDYPQGAPAGTFNNNLPVISTVYAAGGLDSMSNNGSVTVATSKTTIGTWTTTGAIRPGGNWRHNVGEQEMVKTGHYSTSYTFPGSSATNIQRVYALDNGDKPPINWGVNPDSAYGYYGLISNDTTRATQTTTWVKTA